MKHSISLTKSVFLLVWALSIPFDALHAQTSEATKPKKQSSSLMSSERLEENFGSDWTTVIQQEIAGMSTILSYRRQGTPLIVIDGVTLPSHIRLGALFFSSAQIGKIEFLRGPEAIMRYGTRGNNGVLIIDSKKGNIGQGLHTGVYSGMRFDNLSNDQTSTRLNWQEGAYLNWGDEKHTIYAGYNSQLVYQKEFTPASPLAFTQPKSRYFNNSLNTQLHSQWNEKLSTQIGGNFQLRNGVGKTESAEQFGGFNVGIQVQPASWASMKLTAGMNNHQDYSNNQEFIEHYNLPDLPPIFIDSIQSTNSEIDFLMYQNHPLNENLKLTAETGISYFQTSQEQNKTMYRNNIYSSRNDYTVNTFYNGLALMGLEYQHWIRLKAGIQFQNEKNFDANTPFISLKNWNRNSISPYASFTLEADRLIPENNILTTLHWQTSYGENIAVSPNLPEVIDRYKSLQNGFQTRLSAGLFNDRLMIESSYFAEANWEQSFLPKAFLNGNYRGFESLLSAKVIQNEKLEWTAGITSLIMQYRFLLDSKEDLPTPPANSILFAYTAEDLPGEANPWTWQNGLINRLSWKNFNLHLQMNLFNAPQSIVDNEFKRPVSFYTTDEEKNKTYYTRLALDELQNINIYSLKIQEITLSYSTPMGMLDNSFFKRINFALSGRNLFNTTNKEGSQTGDVFTDTKNQQYMVNLGLHF